MLKEIVLKTKNYPKIFIEKSRSYMAQLENHNGSKDFFIRSVKEELGELISNKSANNRSLLIDDVVDSTWVLLAGEDYDEVSFIFKFDSSELSDTITLIEDIENSLIDLISKYSNGQKINHLVNSIFMNIAKICYINNIDWDKAFKALCDENMSKFGFENLSASEYKLHDIFRNNKMNKKDDNGVNYSWFNPADFTIF